MTGTVLTGGRYLTRTQLEEALWRLEELRAGGVAVHDIEQRWRYQGLELRNPGWHYEATVPMEDLAELAEPGEFKKYWNKWHCLPRKAKRSRGDRKLPFEEFKTGPLKTFRVVFVTTKYESYEHVFTQEEFDQSYGGEGLRGMIGQTSTHYRQVSLSHQETFRAKNRATLARQLKAAQSGRGIESIEEVTTCRT